MEKQAIIIAKQQSFHAFRQDTRITFKDAFIEVNTKKNSGIVDTGDIIFTQKCFFVALSDGLSSYGIDHFTVEGKIMMNTPFNLMKIADFLDLEELIDTDKSDHIRKIEKLVMALPFISIIVFFGNRTTSGWGIIPDPICPPIGTGEFMIHILNENSSHFEFITTKPSKFYPYAIPSINSSIIIKDQGRAFDHVKKINLKKDELVAKKLQENEIEEHLELEKYLLEIELMEKNEKIKEDEEFARLVQMQLQED